MNRERGGEEGGAEGRVRKVGRGRGKESDCSVPRCTFEMTRPTLITQPHIDRSISGKLCWGEEKKLRQIFDVHT